MEYLDVVDINKKNVKWISIKDFLDLYKCEHIVPFVYERYNLIKDFLII